jgi:hypothetical protein
MALSLGAAMVAPFHTFLIAYAFLGPLHYLTEISWLHDRQYFTTSRYDFYLFLLISAFISLDFLVRVFQLSPSFSQFVDENNLIVCLTSFALLGSLPLLFSKSIQLKSLILSSLFAFLYFWMIPSIVDTNMYFIIISLLPTLIHVGLFTGFFILFGSLKSKSKSGLLSFVIFLGCPLILWFLSPDSFSLQTDDATKETYLSNGYGFGLLNYNILTKFNLGVSANINPREVIFESKEGILVMRVIAFFYLYHYLNWFSKTEILKWHKIPVKRLVVILLLWVTSCLIYFMDYFNGMVVLFFLSYCHVLLEFPLNIYSIIGIGKESYKLMK